MRKHRTTASKLRLRAHCLRSVISRHKHSFPSLSLLVTNTSRALGPLRRGGTMPALKQQMPQPTDADHLGPAPQLVNLLTRCRDAYASRWYRATGCTRPGSMRRRCSEHLRIPAVAAAAPLERSAVPLFCTVHVLGVKRSITHSTLPRRSSTRTARPALLMRRMARCVWRHLR